MTDHSAPAACQNILGEACLQTGPVKIGGQTFLWKWCNDRSFDIDSQYFHNLINMGSTVDRSVVRAPWAASSYNCVSQTQYRMPKKATSSRAQILLFPNGLADREGGPETQVAFQNRSQAEILSTTCEVVLSGSFRRDLEGLRTVHEELTDLGCRVLSPTHVDPSKEVEGFVFMKGEEVETPERIELHHLDAIRKASFVWLHAPEGYVGLSAALEVGFAHAQGVPVFCQSQPADITIRPFVREVKSIAEVVSEAKENKLPIPAPNLRTFQSYYKRVASQRGYERETAQNCLLLMVEEVGELARAIRKREKLVRHGRSKSDAAESQELADVFLYVVHMANILGLDLGSAVRNKEFHNLARFVASHR